ncbi:hypothetical protein BMS3Abin03_00296 [bacterium BMS3Abin03]|nr:hypothetical protein BMS3Abin03_00296 [bacterium BMS3Abin03]
MLELPDPNILTGKYCIKMYQYNNITIAPPPDIFGKLLEYMVTKNSNKILQLKMTELDVKKLTSTNSDWELNQYTLLSRFKEWERSFRKNKLYPQLDQSVRLNEKLQEILQENLESKWWLEKEARPKVINHKYIVFEKAQQLSSRLNLLLDFVEWALKLNRPVMEEGLVIKEFVEDNIIVDRLNSDLNYRGMGYFTLNDNAKEVLNVYLYDIKWEWVNGDPKQIIKTRLIRSIPNVLIDKSIEAIMEDFIRFSQPLYKPVVYIMHNDLDFPYKETVFPVAEEKLLKEIMV